MKGDGNSVSELLWKRTRGRGGRDQQVGCPPQPHRVWPGSHCFSSLNAWILWPCFLPLSVNDLIVSDKGDYNNRLWLEGKIYSMLEAGFVKWATLPIDICFCKRVAFWNTVSCLNRLRLCYNNNSTKIPSCSIQLRLVYSKKMNIEASQYCLFKCHSLQGEEKKTCILGRGERSINYDSLYLTATNKADKRKWHEKIGRP